MPVVFQPLAGSRDTTSVSQMLCQHFCAAAARIWNSLPSTVTTAETLNSFKKHLKIHLFHCSFPSL